MKVNGESGEVTMAWRDRRAIVLHRAAFTCEACKDATATEVDHIWPRSWGGQDDLSNLRATCLPCNRSKGGKALLRDLTDERAGWASYYFLDKARVAMVHAIRFTRVETRLARDWKENLDQEQVYNEAAAEWTGDVSMQLFHLVQDNEDPGPSWTSRKAWSAPDAASFAARSAHTAASAERSHADFMRDYEILLPKLLAGMTWGEAEAAQYAEMEAAGIDSRSGEPA